MDTLAEREISFYAEDGNIDIFVSIARSVCDGVTVSRQYCSRSRGAFWTDPDVEYCNLEGGFFATVGTVPKLNPSFGTYLNYDIHHVVQPKRTHHA